MIGLIFYLIGCVLAAIWCYRMVIKEEDALSIKDILFMTFVIIFSWLSVVIIVFNSPKFYDILGDVNDVLSKKIIKLNKK